MPFVARVSTDGLGGGTTNVVHAPSASNTAAQATHTTLRQPNSLPRSAVRYCFGVSMTPFPCRCCQSRVLMATYDSLLCRDVTQTAHSGHPHFWGRRGDEISAAYGLHRAHAWHEWRHSFSSIGKFWACLMLYAGRWPRRQHRYDVVYYARHTPVDTTNAPEPDLDCRTSDGSGAAWYGLTQTAL